MSGIIDGKAIAEQIKKEVRDSVKAFHQQTGLSPTLAAILVGNDPSSRIYVRNKVKACESVGIQSRTHFLSAGISQTDLLHFIRTLNDDKNVHGILLQLPLPPHLEKQTVLDAILPEKDVDGLHPVNIGLLVQNRGRLIACTPSGIVEGFKRSGVSLSGKRCVLVGRSDLVGKPLAFLLLHEDATVTICHSRTQQLSAITVQADIVISAIGKAAYLKPEFFRDGAILVDVGINVLKTEQEIVHLFGSSSKKVEDFRQGKNVIVGDMHPAAYEKAALYTPVPGGIGPLTIAMLLQNTVKAAQLQR